MNGIHEGRTARDALALAGTGSLAMAVMKTLQAEEAVCSLGAIVVVQRNGCIECTVSRVYHARVYGAQARELELIGSHGPPVPLVRAPAICDTVGCSGLT